MQIFSISLVGAVFLLAALLKAYYSRLFIIHITRLSLFPEKPGALLALLFIEFEAGLGAALLLRVYLNELIPLTLVLLSVFSVISWWSTKSGRADDCGCYGSFISLSLKQTLGLNGVYGGLLCWAMVQQKADLYTPEWKIWVVVGVILGFHFVAKRSVFKPLFNLTGIKKGKAWNPKWFKTDPSLNSQPVNLMIMLDQQCSQCGDWWDRLHAMEEKTDQIRIVILVAKGFVESKKMEARESLFPIFESDSFTMKGLHGQLPMAILVKEGEISEIWRKSFPFDLLGR